MPKGIYKTCLFKIHNASKRRRAMMLDSLWRVDRAYWKILGENYQHATQLDKVLGRFNMHMATALLMR